MTVQTSDRSPSAARPTSFVRYLSRRRRRGSGSSISYEVVVLVLWFGPGIALGVWLALTGQPPQTPPITISAAAALLAAAAVGVGLICCLLGPITAPPEWRAWLLTTPLDRGMLLTRRLRAVLAIAVIPGLIVGAVLAEAAGLRRWAALAGIVAGILCAVTASALAIWVESRIGARPTVALRVMSGCLLGLIAVAAVLMKVRTGPPSDDELWTLAAALGVAAVASAVAARRRLRHIPITALARGSGASASLALAVYEQSLEPLAPVVSRVHISRRGKIASRTLAGVGQQALASVTRLLLRRHRAVVVRWALLATVPYAALGLLAGIGWGRSAFVVVTYLAAVAAFSGLCGTVRKFAASPSLADRYGLDRALSKRTAMTVPYAGAAAWAAITAPALLLIVPPFMAVLIPAAAMVLVEFRARLAPYEPTFTMGQEYPSDLGPRFLRGPVWLFGSAFLFAIIIAGSA